MNNILHDSNLKITSLVEKFMKNTLKNSANEFALTDFTDNLMDSLMEYTICYFRHYVIIYNKSKGDKYV